MICPNCKKEILDCSEACSYCGAEITSPNPIDWDALSPEERARKKWEIRERKRKETKRKKGKKATKKSKVRVEKVNDPIADEIQSLVDKLSEEPIETKKEEPQEVFPEVESKAEYASVQDEPMSIQTVLEETEQQIEPEESDWTQQAEESKAPAEVRPQRQEVPATAQELEPVLAEESPEPASEPTIRFQLDAEQDTEEKSVPEAIQTDTTMRINVQGAFDEMEEFPDIRIPEIYAKAKYVSKDSEKWAKEAAKNQENDWAGFDPDASDWIEEDRRMSRKLFWAICIVLVISVGLALFSVFTSHLI